MVFSGSTAPGRSGRTCPSVMVRLAPCRAGSIAGARPGLVGYPGGASGLCRSPGPGRLEPAFRRQHHRPRPPARGRRPQGRWRKRGICDEALGRSRGGFTTKIHIRAEGLGKPVTFSLTGGQVHDSQQFATLMGTGWICRLGRGRPRLKPDRVAGDKAYSSGKIREALRRRGIGAVIPTKENERRQPDFDREARSRAQARSPSRPRRRGRST